MQIHITKIYNIGGTAAQSQHMVAEIAKSVLNWEYIIIRLNLIHRRCCEPDRMEF